MLSYRAVFHKALRARMVHTMSCDLRQSGPRYDTGMEMLVKSLKLPDEQIENLKYDDVDDMYDQSTNSIDAALHAVPEDIRKERRFVMGKIIEQKYFKDLYKIKPGEVYNRNKDPFFQKGRDCKDFRHKHHNSIKKNAILAERTPKSVGIDDILLQRKYQQSPLNLLHSVDSPNSPKINKASSKYTSVHSFLSSPDEAYHSPSNNHNSDQLDTGRSILLAEHHPVLDQIFKVPKLVAAVAKESDLRPAEDEQSSNSFSDYNGPCLMLWSMKEQMRYLRGTDPVYWSPEMLSTVFPISPDNAKKLLRSRWVPENEQELARHDSRILDHWKQLSGGQLRSHALVTKAMQNRLQTSNEPVGGLPVPSAVNDQMMDILDKLQFEHPEQAKKQGVSPVSRPSGDPPEYGYFADIVRNYKAKVDALHNEARGDEATTADLYSSELDVSAVLPSPQSYEGRAVTVRGVATFLETPIERYRRTASSEEQQNQEFSSSRQHFIDWDGARLQQRQQEMMRRPLLLNARPGLERLKLMEEEDSLELGVSPGSVRGRHGSPHDDDEAVSVARHGRPQHGDGEAVSVARHGRPQHGDAETVSFGRHGRPGHGDGKAVTSARPGARPRIVEKSVEEPRKYRQERNKKLQVVDVITYDQFVKMRGKGSHQEVNSNKKQDGYFDLKDLNFLFSKPTR